VWENPVAFACSAILKDSLSLLDPDVPADSQLFRVLNGFHALLPYSIDFWVYHVLACAAGEHLEVNSPTARVLTEFDTFHKQLAQRLRLTSTNHTITVGDPDSRLQAVSHLPIAPLCAAILTFRAQSKTQPAINGEGKHFLNSTPTPANIQA
jgi:hypothetical protein